MNFASTKERILQLIDFKKLTISKFLSDTGIKRGFLDTDKLKSSVSDVFLAMIIATYDDVSIEWLITGKGDMLKETKSNDYKSEENELQKVAQLDNDFIIELLKDQVTELKKDKEELKKDKDVLLKDKYLLASLIETKLGNQEAS